MTNSESLNNIETELPVEAVQWSNAIKSITSIEPQRKQTYVYKPVITYERYTVFDTKHISSPLDLIELMKTEMLGPIERVGALFLSTRNDVIEKYLFTVMTVGTVDQAPVYPREIFKMAILNNASRVVVCHSHPSNYAFPSQADHAITRSLKEGAKLLNLDFLDHIILTEDSYYSFSEHGEL